MQNNESSLTQLHSPSVINSFGSQRTVIAVVITALIFGAGGYLLRDLTAQNSSRGNQENLLLTSPIPTRELSPNPTPSSIPFIPKTFYPVPTTNPVLTANWKTYKSNKYGFSFHYPPDMYANPSNRTQTDQQLFPDNIEFQNKPIPLYDFGHKDLRRIKQR